MSPEFARAAAEAAAALFGAEALQAETSARSARDDHPVRSGSPWTGCTDPTPSAAQDAATARR